MAASDEIRVQALGFSVDDTPSGGAAGAIDAWRSTGAAGSRNALNTSVQGGNIDPVPNRAINTLYDNLENVTATTNGFEDRFSDVVGDEGGADQTAFDSLGTNLIQAVAHSKWTHDFTSSNSWTCAHSLGYRYVSVLAVKNDGTIMIPDIDYATATDNSVTLHFAAAVTGTAVIRR